MKFIKLTPSILLILYNYQHNKQLIIKFTVTDDIQSSLWKKYKIVIYKNIIYGLQITTIEV